MNIYREVYIKRRMRDRVSREQATKELDQAPHEGWPYTLLGEYNAMPEGENKERVLLALRKVLSEQIDNMVAAFPLLLDRPTDPSLLPVQVHELDPAQREV